ncbi:hypothetical protein CC80DRAFT_491708 [Byssothecium circinans]|uniref:Protein kinase domain-containing protein n=1 Tax=Byssothecium circinans TaxID=147558 RepID=A0A6A5TZZ4_9PLEO|nr:hypothetical protein CC80DRAFT_491708 [Byssothecium circinans]
MHEHLAVCCKDMQEAMQGKAYRCPHSLPLYERKWLHIVLFVDATGLLITHSKSASLLHIITLIMGSPFRRLTWRSPRLSCFLCCRIILITILICFLQQQHLFYSYRHALSAKYSPTYFSNNSEHFLSQPGHLNDNKKRLQDVFLARRQDWKVLGSGWEGTIYTYRDSVIKTFKTGQSPLRNCIHSQTAIRWPTEIPASLHFGALHEVHRPVNETPKNTSAAPPGFLPIRAYFQATSPTTSLLEWHLVTPLVPGGSLKSLAKRIHYSPTPPSFRDLDTKYRPSFHRLLETLDIMHRDGYCHDDVKPANIFVRGDTDWVLGDLGNVRHVAHPYHASRIWRENHQLADCRPNDVVRALKTYLYFLRKAARDRDTFDAGFFERREPLSILYWSVMIDPENVDARWLRSLSFSTSPLPTQNSNAHPTAYLDRPLPMYTFRSTLRRRAVKETLRTSMSDTPAIFWSISWLLGPPESPC